MLAYNVSDGAAFVTKGLVSRNGIFYPDIEIPRNKATFIIGESGTGKTTLLKLFNQMETQSSGTILFFGEDVSRSKHTTDLRTNAVLCGQSVFLFGGTIKDNFDEFRRYIKLPPLSDDRIVRLLKVCGLECDLGKLCRNMSGGERARVFIAVHLSLTPAVLMLDEPTSALDYDTAVTMMQNIKSYCAENGMTLIVVSHDRSIVDAVADNVIDLGGRKTG